ncbi:MAG: nucleotidyl transferase AbiEii/AbiGii toxin family protein [Deltaproteobacteria bacterium]|nr:nucleotidyl transferase AbiEii/AbiGii toxin family protein [Deltaproteobacteria bacterium]
MERFLYRLSTSPHADKFVLKGALMLRVWEAPAARPTRDIDLLGRMDNSPENLARVVAEVCEAEVEPDGLVFKVSTVKAIRIKEDADYAGVRVRFEGLLGKAKIPMQIDVGFGDVVVPAAKTVGYPTLLEFPAPRMKGYPRETVVAEKFEAMVKLGTLNSRMKDFFDIWLMARQFDFDGALLGRAVTSTFRNRKTAIDPRPVALTPAFTESSTTEAQWRAFLRRGKFAHVPERLADVAAALAEFLLPVAAGAIAGSFEQEWRAPGPWSRH